MRHAISAEDKLLAFEINAESGRINLALCGDTATIAATERALAAASKMRRLAATMQTALRRQLAAARQAKREAEREAEKAERRNDAIRRDRGLPPTDADLAVPGWS